MGTGYNILVLLHLVCIVGGFGALAYNGLVLGLASRRGPDALAVLEVNRQVSQGAELLVYGAFLFGMAALGSSGGKYGFGQAWVGIAVALFVVLLGLLHGMIRPAQRRYREVATELSKVTVPTPDVVPAQVGALDSLSRRISLGWGAFNVVVVATMAIMIFKPGA